MLKQQYWQRKTSADHTPERDRSVTCLDLGGVHYFPSLRRVRVGPDTNRLPPKPAAILSMLVDAYPEPVSKEEILNAIWPDQTTGDSVISDAVRQLRLATNRSEHFIETVHRHGYRLAVEPRLLATEKPNRTWLRFAAPALIIVIAIAVISNLSQHRQGIAPGTRSEADVFYSRGLQLYRNYRAEDNRLAMELFHRAVEADPGQVRAWSMLANAYSMQSHKFGGSRAWNDRAEGFARDAIRLDPLDPTGHKALGVVLSYGGQFRGAAAAFEDAIERYPGYVGALVNLATVRLEQGRPDQALAVLARALTEAPGSAITHLQMGQSYRMLGMGDLASVWFQKGLDLSPGNPADAFYWIGYLLARGDVSTIDALLQESNPDGDAHAQFWLGMKALYEGRAAEAAAHFAEATSRTEPDSALWIDARLREQISKQIQNGQVEPTVIDEVEAQVLERVSLGSQSWQEPYRLALAAICRAENARAKTLLIEAIGNGWLHDDELNNDPAFSPLGGDALASLSMQIAARRHDLLAALNGQEIRVP